MHRNHEHEQGLRNRHNGRKEWQYNGEQPHQMEAREHARQHGKMHKTYGIQCDEAVRQIRELRARY